MHEGWSKFLVWILTALPLVLMVWQFWSKTKGDGWHQARAWGAMIIPAVIIVWNSVSVEKFTWDLPYIVHFSLGILYFLSWVFLWRSGEYLKGWSEWWARSERLMGVRHRHRLVAKITVGLYVAQAIAAMMIPLFRAWLA